MLVFGTRPEAIKMAPLVKCLQQRDSEFEPIICVTGQHREMLDQVLRIFDIKPDYDLNIMKAGQDLYDITTRVLLGMRDILAQVKPDIVLVHGDTTTSTASALAAFYQQIPVGHVEAGLRTHNIYSPWPEEMNRQITGRISTLDFAPTPLSRQNLLDEGVTDEHIYVTGNTVIDALHMVVNKIKGDDQLAGMLTQSLGRQGYDVYRLKQGRRLVLITGHRRENFGDGFLNICNAIKHLNEKYPEVDFVYPMHLNPNVRKPIHKIFGDNLNNLGNLFFIEPLEYLDFVFLMEKSYIVLTDSGGIQEEAPGLGKPVLVMRDTTERPEALDAGTVKLVGTDYNKIVDNVSLLLDDEKEYDIMSRANNPYGGSTQFSEMIKNNNMKGKILVAGGMGFIGSHTTVELQNAGYEVVIIDNLSNSNIEVLDGIEKITGIRPVFVEGDCTDINVLRKMFTDNPGINGIIDFAASKAVGESVQKPIMYYRNNLNILLNLLELMPEFGVKGFVFSSSCTVYGEPDKNPITEDAPTKKATSPYGATKQVSEDIIADVIKSGSPIKAVLLRYFNPIGAHPSAEIGELPNGVPANLVPYLTQTAIGVRKELSIFGDDYDTPDGSCIRDFINVVDLAKAHVKALERMLEDKSNEPLEVFNIGTGEGASVLQLLAAFEKATGVKVPHKIVGRRDGDIVKIWADPKKANEVLGWKAEETLEDTMLSAWRWQQRLRERGIM